MKCNIQRKSLETKDVWNEGNMWIPCIGGLNQIDTLGHKHPHVRVIHLHEKSYESVSV